MSARTALLAFRQRYNIYGDELEMYDITDVREVLKATRNIRLCTGYLE